MRLLGILLVSAMLVSVTHAGECPDCPPPALHDEEARPTTKQAVAAAKKLLKGLRSKKQERVRPALAMPFLYDITGRALPDMGCYDGASFVVEAEAMPGRPECLIATFLKVTRKLDAKATRKNVFANLARLQKKHGALRSPAVAELENLANHQFVYLAKGAWKVVLAVRLSGGAPAVDAVVVEPPKGWTPAAPELTEPDRASTKLEASHVKAGILKVKDAILHCGGEFPGVTGVVKLKVKVSPAGAVTEVTVAATPDADLGECAANVMRRAAFEPTDQGGSFTYPFTY